LFFTRRDGVEGAGIPSAAVARKHGVGTK